MVLIWHTWNIAACLLLYLTIGLNVQVLSLENSHIIHWLGSQEGISMQMYNLELLYGLSLEKGFSIAMLSFHNKKHYPDKDHINLCAIFEFPSNILCHEKVDRAAFANDHHCSVLRKADVDAAVPSPLPLPVQEKWYFVPRTYNLEAKFPISYDEAVSYDDYNWGAPSGCLIGSPAYFLNCVPFSEAAARHNIRPGHHLPIAFTSYYVGLYQKAMRSLQWDGARYAAAHWRRGDQLIMRCPPAGFSSTASTNSNRSNYTGLVSVLDKSVNCAPVEIFVDTVLRDCCQSSADGVGARLYNVYVATNEKNPAVVRRMKKLSNGNIKTYSDLKLGKLGSVDRFVVEVLIMIHADTFHSYGVSAVHLLVEKARGRGRGTITPPSE